MEKATLDTANRLNNDIFLVTQALAQLAPKEGTTQLADLPNIINQIAPYLGFQTETDRPDLNAKADTFYNDLKTSLSNYQLSLQNQFDELA